MLHMGLCTSCHAYQALLDGLQHPEIEKLASAGTWGQFPSHCNRDLLRWLGPILADAPVVEIVKVPVVDTKNNQKVNIDLQLQLPHDIFYYYSKKTPQEFRQLFGSPEQIRRYWQHKDLQDPAYVRHPALEKLGYETLAIPCKLHSDAAVLTRYDSLHIISWCSLFSRGGTTLDSQFYYTSLVKAAAHAETWPLLFRILAWSFNACLQGKHPARDWDGVEFPPASRRGRLANQALNRDGYFLAMFMIIADLEELCNMYGLRHFNGNECCFFCKANTSTLPWSDLSPEALWRHTLEKWPDTQHPPTPLNIWNIAGLTLFSVQWDMLHGLDLGPALHVNGNLLEDMVHWKVFGRNQDSCASKTLCIS